MINRNPDAFKIMANFLEYGEKAIKSLDEFEQHMFQQEKEYWGLLSKLTEFGKKI